ncbi:MAG: sulfatase, partial [Planctomycetota bacterium]
ETVDRALDWIGGLEPERPFFLWVHLYDAHHPYDPPPEVAEAFGSGRLDSRQGTIRDYDRDVLYVDRQVRRLFEALKGEGLLAQADWIVAADHGEGFWEHGLVGHSPHLYQEQLHVPFLMGGPGIASGRVAGPRVGLIDVLPTLLGRLGIGPPAGGLEGRDLGPLLEGRVVAEDWNRPLFAVRRLYNQPSFARLLKQGCDEGWDLSATRLEEHGFGPMAALVQGPWKLIWTQGSGIHLPEVYHLERDPAEQHDLQDPNATVQTALRERLARWVKASAGKALIAEPAGEAAFRRLAELGYIHLPDEPAPPPSGKH